MLAALDRHLLGLVPIKRKVEEIASLLLFDRAGSKFGTGEVVVTQTVRSAVYGSSLAFRPRSNVDLAGAGSWSLFTAIQQ